MSNDLGQRAVTFQDDFTISCNYNNERGVSPVGEDNWKDYKFKVRLNSEAEYGCPWPLQTHLNQLGDWLPVVYLGGCLPVAELWGCLLVVHLGDCLPVAQLRGIGGAG